MTRSAGPRPGRWDVVMCLPLAGEASDIGKCSKAIEQVQEELGRARQELAAVRVHDFFAKHPFLSSISVSWEARYDDNGMPLGEGVSCKVYFDDDEFSHEAWTGVEHGKSGLVGLVSIHMMESDLNQIFVESNVRCPSVVLERGSALVDAARLFMGERALDWLARVQARALDQEVGAAPSSGPGSIRI